MVQYHPLEIKATFWRMFFIRVWGKLVIRKFSVNIWELHELACKLFSVHMSVCFTDLEDICNANNGLAFHVHINYALDMNDNEPVKNNTESCYFHFRFYQ